MCYSHKDLLLKDMVLKQFGSAGGSLNFEVWHDREIQLGTAWHEQIVDSINNSYAAILLISPDLLTNKYVVQEEFPRISERLRANKTQVFPLLLRHVLWQHHPWLSKLQIASAERPVSELRGTPAKEKAISQFARSVIESLLVNHR